MKQLRFPPMTDGIFELVIGGIGRAQDRTQFWYGCAAVTAHVANLDEEGVAGEGEAVLDNRRGERHGRNFGSLSSLEKIGVLWTVSRFELVELGKSSP